MKINEAKQFPFVLKILAIFLGKDCNIETELFF
jgi:hypothetical protein